ncbi:hypothetical protein CAEBREN_07169 [Caenorhabditis brenneri]|uniref:Cystatin domain-containing protein n=1 Tax=Caenorhabditis brenneri TaxID=135651 RepID=G0NLB4_CAEBE|nr:hypothetical protein CAEBREN_07169 [Caenorhabditis brenneri]
MPSQILFFLLFAFFGLSSATIYWKMPQGDEMSNPMMITQHQVNKIYAAYWDHDINTLFSLLRFGTPMSRFIEDHAEDEIHVRVKSAEYYSSNNQQGIKAILTIEDVSATGTTPYLVKMAMAQDYKSPTGYIVFLWEICSNLECE